MKATLAIFSIVAAASLCAQDGQWVRTWEAAQKARPATVPAVARIAPVNELGTPLVVHGRVVQRDGSPAPNVIVFAYHTDSTGVYNRKGSDGWRLRGWARSDSKGNFEFRTIRPGSYPQGRTPAHIHLTIEGPGLPRRTAGAVEFRDDPFLSDSAKREASDVTARNGVQHVNMTIRVSEDGRF